MINRIVKMTFDPTKIEAFKAVFESSKEQIRAMEGCEGLRLLQDLHNPAIFFTYSLWQSEAHLNAYRDSALFEGVWAETKALFAGKPEAWSTSVLHHLN